jgi:hypothetical protein
MIQRDYIERLIEQCAMALRRVLGLRRAGQQATALQVVRDGQRDIAGPLRPLLDRLEASSAVEVAGAAQADRVRLFATLLGEEGLIHRELGDTASAYLCCRHSLELFAALSLAGTQFARADRERIAVLTSIVDVDELDDRYRDALRRLPSAD